MFNPDFQPLDSGEPTEERNARRARGEINSQEMAEYLTHPEDVLFEHELGESKIKVRALTKELTDATLESLKDSWDEPTFNDLKDTLRKYFEQKESGKPALLNVEYFVATDQADKPLAMTGFYSVDIEGGAGLATRDKLDSQKHSFNLSLGWYSVSKAAQGMGIGKYFLNWTENVAKSMGANHFGIETDDSEYSAKAVKIYGKSGYKEGTPIKDFYGPGRNLHLYYCNSAKDKTEDAESTETAPGEITAGNKEEILRIAKETYDPDKFAEFEACLDIFLSQDSGRESIMQGRSVVLNNVNGEAQSFAIYVDGVYKNDMPVYWTGVRANDAAEKARLLGQLKTTSRQIDKNVIIIYSQNSDNQLEGNGFTEAEHGVPEVFEKEDPTNLLLFTKFFK